MTVSLTHAMVSAVPDNEVEGEVGPSEWNDQHVLTLAAGKVLGRDTSGAGAVQELPIAVDSAGNVGLGQSVPVNKLDLNGSFGRNAPVTKTANFSLAPTENWVICNGSGSITATLPAASSWTGREVMFKTIAAQAVVSASSNVVPVGSATAGTEILPASAGNWAVLVSDGTSWVVVLASASGLNNLTTLAEARRVASLRL